MSKISLVQFQFVLFFDEIENRPDKLANKVEDALGGIFDQMPTILPIPPDAPIEVPSVIMKSSNGIYTCNVAKNRVDFIVNYTNDGESISISFEKFNKLINSFSTAVYSYKNIVRFGLIGTYFCKDNDPANRIKTKYFQKEIGDLTELNVRFNKRFTNNNIVFNDIVEVNNASVNENGIDIDGIIIQRDMNNVPVKVLPLEEVFSVISSNQKKFHLSGITELIE